MEQIQKIVWMAKINGTKTPDVYGYFAKINWCRILLSKNIDMGILDLKPFQF